MNWNLRPPEGYVYYDLDGAKLVAPNWHELARKLFLLHKRVGTPISLDEAYSMIERQVCQRDPILCPELKSRGFVYSRAKDVVRKRVSLFDYQKAIRWLIQKARECADRGLPGFVRDDVAEARAKICYRCVYHKFYNQACSGCRENLKSLRSSILGDRKAGFGLGYCGLFYDDLAVKIYLSEAYIIDGDIRSRMPPECWRNDIENR